MRQLQEEMRTRDLIELPPHRVEPRIETLALTPPNVRKLPREHGQGHERDEHLAGEGGDAQRSRAPGKHERGIEQQCAPAAEHEPVPKPDQQRDEREPREGMVKKKRLVSIERPADDRHCRGEHQRLQRRASGRLVARALAHWERLISPSRVPRIVSAVPLALSPAPPVRAPDPDHSTRSVLRSTMRTLRPTAGSPSMPLL